MNRPTHTTQPTEADEADRPEHARAEPRDLLELLAAEQPPVTRPDPA